MNHKLAKINVEEAHARFKANQPVNLRQLAVVLGISYSLVCGWKELPGFPYAERLIFPEDFRLWRQRRFGLTGRASVRKETRELPQAEERGHKPPRLLDDIPPNLPERARRLFEQARKR